MPPRRTRLQRLLATLAAHHGPLGPTTTDPWHLILLENVVYLADPDTRTRAFRTLRDTTRLDATTLASCPDEVLHQACGQGRMADNQILELRTCAELFQTEGDPRDLVKLPRPKARRALERFPGIGDPGADKLLLFAGVQPVLALDSNGLRVLLRLGYGSDSGAYAAQYRSATQAATAELPADCETLVHAHLVLQHHGRELCRNRAPACPGCPVRRSCPGAS